MRKIVVFSLFSLLLLTSSCTEDIMDRLNNNDNHPLNAPAKFILPQVATSTAFSTVGGDFSLYASIYMEHEVGVHNQTYNAEVRLGEPTRSTTYNNAWEATYNNVMNAKLAIKKCSQGGIEEGNEITLAMAKIFLAYNAAILTDLFGDTPYAEAGLLTETGLPLFRQPKVDKQEVIYADIFKQLDEAIQLFETGKDASINSSPIGSNDLIYGANRLDKQKELWIKAAYALKARYTMRLLAKSTNVDDDLTKVLDYISKSFTSSDEEFKYALYDAGNATNPLGAFSYNRNGLAASRSFINKLNKRNDPRLTQIFMNAKDKIKTAFADIDTAPNGEPIQEQLLYDFSATIYSFVGVTMLMSYHELMFLKAEAHARLNDLPSAEVALKEGIIAGLVNVETSAGLVINYQGDEVEIHVEFEAADVETYFTNGVKPLFDTNPLSEIAIQKYIAFMGASGEAVEAFNDYRRFKALGETFVTLDNPKNADYFPLRFVYGNSDVLANPAVAALTGDGQYVYKEKVWWAGGTR